MKKLQSHKKYEHTINQSTPESVVSPVYQITLYNIVSYPMTSCSIKLCHIISNHIKSLNVISHHIVSHHIILYCITWDQIRSDQIRAEQLRSYEITSYCIESDRVLLYHIKQSPVNSYINKSHHSTRSVVELKSYERHIQYAHTINLSIHTWEFRQSWYRSSNISHCIPLLLYTTHTC